MPVAFDPVTADWDRAETAEDLIREAATRRVADRHGIGDGWGPWHTSPQSASVIQFRYHARERRLQVTYDPVIQTVTPKFEAWERQGQPVTVEYEVDAEVYEGLVAASSKDDFAEAVLYPLPARQA